jgi:hypothetical protein
MPSYIDTGLTTTPRRSENPPPTTLSQDEWRLVQTLRANGLVKEEPRLVKEESQVRIKKEEEEEEIVPRRYRQERLSPEDVQRLLAVASSRPTNPAEPQLSITAFLAGAGKILILACRVGFIVLAALTAFLPQWLPSAAASGANKTKERQECKCICQLVSSGPGGIAYASPEGGEKTVLKPPDLTKAKDPPTATVDTSDDLPTGHTIFTNLVGVIGALSFLQPIVRALSKLN